MNDYRARLPRALEFRDMRVAVSGFRVRALNVGSYVIYGTSFVV